MLERRAVPKQILSVTDMGQSEEVAADFMRQVLGQGGVKFISLLIIVSVLGAINASIFTGSRNNYTLGFSGIAGRGATSVADAG